MASGATADATELDALTALVRVVALLAGESEVTLGYAAGAAGPVALTVSLPDGSWRDLSAAVQAALARATAMPRPVRAGVLFRTGAEVAGAEVAGAEVAGAEPAADPAASLWVEHTPSALRLGTDPRLFDAGYTERVAGYLLQALDSVTAEPDREYAEVDLLSACEREHLVHGRAGAVTELPGRRFHEIFTDQARHTPDAPALIHSGQTWSYDRLDRAANTIAHALLAAGVVAEDVVAIATRRHPNWVASVIGIFKAGGAYLPVEPTYPAARVATLLERSRCRVVLTDPGVAIPPEAGATVLVIDDLLAAPPPGAEEDPAVAVRADQLAYIYFTSGSTGTPKAAMCQHDGMLNHLYAKIDDLRIVAGDVAVQNAQLSFDISLWQFAAPLLVGARVVVLTAEEILDVRRFLDVVTGAGTTVLQVVPSYLDVLLRHLERAPQALAPLRELAVTGEAITPALVQRWFAAYPDIRLINCYGATEVSDDTTHEILTAAPDGAVPVGRPLNNVTAYILGRGDALVPLGAPGEIVFSGVCVGRGYLHEPARTAEAFADDPFRPGERIYRTGDFGRWLPTGHLEYHGRRDEQVKIRGIRIELGEVENRIRQHPAVGAASVVVVAPSGADKWLAGFYTSEAGLDPAPLREHLQALLPPGAVPARLYRLDALPLNDNGKVEKKTLSRTALELAEVAAPTGGTPTTPTQRRLASAFATALGRPVGELGLDAHFFDLGGTSLSALRAVAGLDGLVTLDDLLRHPVLGALATAVDGPAGGETSVLRLLAGDEDGATLALVCLPYAAGSAVTYHALAEEVARRDPGVAVYGVQAPGHDLGRPDEAALELADLAELVAQEAANLDRAVAVWGQCAGAPLAVEVAARLDGQLRHVFLAARVVEPPAELAREVATVVAATDADLALDLVKHGGLDEVVAGELGPAELGQIGRTYRHDVRAANQYLLDAAGSPPRPLAAPVTVILSTSDEQTAGVRDAGGGWAAYAEQVELVEVDGGGHYFPQALPGQTAQVVLDALAAHP